MSSDTSSGVLQNDLIELLTILGMSTHARPQSPHEVFQEALSVLRDRLTRSGEASVLVNSSLLSKTAEAIDQAKRARTEADIAVRGRETLRDELMACTKCSEDRWLMVKELEAKLEQLRAVLGWRWSS